MTVKHKCSGKILGLRSNKIYKCSRNATVQRNGKWYCWQHDPERVKADAERRRVTQEIKRNVLAALWERRTRNSRLAKLVTPELAELLEWLACYEDVQANKARELAAKIREILDDSQA